MYKLANNNNARTVMSATPVTMPATTVVVQDNSVDVPGQLDMLPVPMGMTQTITSATGGGAETKTIYFGNEAAFNATPTNNGSGANSITNTYGDGWSGKGYNQLFTSLTNGRGLQCYGFTIEFVITATGVQNPAGISLAQPSLLNANLVGNRTIPYGFVLSTGQRNTQFQTGTMTVKKEFFFNCLSQLAYDVPVGNTATLTIMTKPFTA